MFLVFFCRDECPHTYILNCTVLPSLRTRRCVSIEFSCVRFPCIDQSFRQGALSVSGLFDASGFCTIEELVETVKARFIVVGSDFAMILSSPSSCCILFRHRFSAAGQSEILRATERAEMADVKQLEKIVPLITCEISLSSICLRVGAWSRRT